MINIGWYKGTNKEDKKGVKEFVENKMIIDSKYIQLHSNRVFDYLFIYKIYVI